MNCRFCETPLTCEFLDLGTAPPSNAFLAESDLNKPEAWYPLKLHACHECHLVQAEEVQARNQIFSPDYLYFSSYSRSWLAHAERFVDLALQRLQLGPADLVVELASNDGYLLQYVTARGIPCLGIEPTEGTALVARSRGIDTIVRFFGRDFAAELVASRGTASLIVANNVLAHVPDINDFVAGMSRLLAAQGVATLEFPHLLELVANRQFDTVYHEHYSYLSFHTVVRIFNAHGLRIWDVESLPTHGGSLRLWCCHQDASRPESPNVAAMMLRESSAGMLDMAWYQGFQRVAEDVKDAFLSFLLEQKRAGKRVAAYGAAAKGNTLINFAGIRADLIQFVVDASPHKQGRYLPGSRIPVVDEAKLQEIKPDVVVVLPWNLIQEISRQLHYIAKWHGRLAVAVPRIELIAP